MYKHQITITLPDDVVHRYSIIEWETILLSDGIIQRDELPLSYGRIAEIIAVELFKYRNFRGVDSNNYTQKEDTTYTNDHGFEVSTRVAKASDLYTLLAEPAANENTMQVGITCYDRSPETLR